MFNVFKKILKNQEITPDELDKISPFIMCRWLAGNAGTLQVAQFLNLYSKIPLKVQVQLIQSILGTRVKYIPYIKGSKVEDKDLEYISKYFNISKEKALMYSEFISNKELKDLKRMFESGVKKS